VRVLQGHVPAELGGVVFLSGGQTSDDAFADLSHIVSRIAQKGPHPWGLTFSYSRALQDPVLQAWAKNPDATKDIQDLFYHQLELAATASKGEFKADAPASDQFVSGAQDL